MDIDIALIIVFLYDSSQTRLYFFRMSHLYTHSSYSASKVSYLDNVISNIYYLKYTNKISHAHTINKMTITYSLE